MIAFGTVTGGASASLTGRNFWQWAATGFAVSFLNHAMHRMEDDNNDTDPYEKWFSNKRKEISNIPKTLNRAINRKAYETLRWGFDGLETVRGWMEIGSVASIIYTRGNASPGAILG